MPESELPRDSAGREHINLALWDNPRRTIPRAVFLYDSMVRPYGMSREAIADSYLRSIRTGEGYKMGKPRRVSIAGNIMWRMDYWRPDPAGQSYNSGIVIPLQDRRVLAIQMNAASARELDLTVSSLQGLKFDQK